MKQLIGADAAVARQSARHKLFVEGDEHEQIDPIVLRELLTRNGLAQVEIVPTGGCSNVRTAAQALIREHPTYYFLTDRDDQDAAVVADAWAKFPDEKSFNLLIWRKRELENYFIEPTYIEKSSFLKSTPAKLRATILKEARSRVYMDAANLVLMKLNREVCSHFAAHFKDVSKFKSEPEALAKLLSLPELPAKLTSVQHSLEHAELTAAYNGFIAEMSGGKLPLEFGVGSWLERMSGKEIFRAIANVCFEVKDSDGNLLHGKEQHGAIAKELLRLPLAEQPSDFVDLTALVAKRVSSAI